MLFLLPTAYKPDYKPDYKPEYKPDYKPAPYNFGYEVDDGYGNKQHNEEKGDDYGNKKGSYGYTDAYGVYRVVDYVADEYGFRATVRTNEPGVDKKPPAAVNIEKKETPKDLYGKLP